MKIYFFNNRLLVKSISWSLLFVFLPVFVFSLTSHPVTVDERFDTYRIDSHIEFIEDKNNILLIENLSNPDSNINWKKMDRIRIGYTKSAYWFRVTLDNQCSLKKCLYLEFDYCDLAHIEFYRPTGKNTYQNSTTGINHPFNTRDIPDRTFVFRICPEPSTSTYYFKVMSHTPLSFSINLMSNRKFIENKNIETAFLFFSYGVLLALVLYNLYLFFNFREPSYLFFVIFVFLMILASLRRTGYGFQYFWTDSPFFLKRSLFPLTYFSIAAMFLFFKSFLNTKKNFPKLHKFILYGVIYPFILMGVIGVLVPLPRPVRVIYLFGIIYGWVAATVLNIQGVYKGSVPAYYTASGVALSLGGLVIFIFKLLGILPSNYITIFSMNIGLLCLTLFSSLGLANKVNIMDTQVKENKKNLERVVKEKSDQLKTSYKHLKEMNQKDIEVLTNVSSISEKISNGAGKVSETIFELSFGANMQTTSLNEISSFMGQIRSQTDSNTELLAKAIVLTSNTINSARIGVERMMEMEKAMGDISESSKGISLIIKTIDSISFQTNLLALNASVEAARAGHHGKGFAVVAEEVRTLATKSTNAAQTTSNLIEDSVKRVEKGGVTAAKTAEALNEINRNIIQIESLIFKISDSGSRQAMDIDFIEKGLVKIQEVIEKHSSSGDETLEASVNFSKQAIEVKDLLNNFKTQVENL